MMSICAWIKIEKTSKNIYMNLRGTHKILISIKQSFPLFYFKKKYKKKYLIYEIGKFIYIGEKNLSIFFFILSERDIWRKAKRMEK